MLSLFDSGALIACLMCAHLFKGNRNGSIFIFISLLVHSAVNLINLNFMGENYYLFIAGTEFLLVLLGISMRVKVSILIIFLMSLVYNGLSFVEFNTEHTFIYDNYSLVMKSFIISLLFIIFKNGLTNGSKDSHNNRRDTDNSSYSRLFYRGL